MSEGTGIHDYAELRKKHLARWMKFTNQRFEPLSHFLMIALFLFAHYFVADASKLVILEPIHILWVGLGTTCFFLKLRFYDEIKDYEIDLEKNPNHPLPSGLLFHFDLKKGIENCIILEVIFFASCGIPGLVMILFSIAYSLFMYKEFFIGKYIRPHLTTYATTHTVVTLFLSFSIFSALSRYYPWNYDSDFYYFALMSWLLFNIFELGRKIYQKEEEREGVPTYSSIWGKSGAFALVFFHAILVSYCVLQVSTIDFYYMQYFMIVSMGLLLLFGLIYIITTTPKTGALFRHFSSLYIVIVYGGILYNYVLRKWG